MSRPLFTSRPDEPLVLSVWELTEQLKDVVEDVFPDVWVSGEVSNFSRPASGHCYFTLKDERAQLRAVVWRSTAARLRFDLEDGLQVICQGGLEVYAPRGQYQLVVRQVLPKGLGALELALRKLRERLAAEGLFDPARKRPLPPFPHRIAVVTSPTGAAVRDFLQVLSRRWPAVDVLIVPTRVQGDGAAAEIAAAIQRVNQLAATIDTLVVTRGGGSLEDLWAFNEEAVVRAIAGSRIPVVSAIGHEIDITLSDLAADVRALTPSEAAERVVPSRDELRVALDKRRRQLIADGRRRLATVRSRLDALAARRPLRRPLDRIHDLARRLDELELRAGRAVRQRVNQARVRTSALAAQLDSLSPSAVLSRGYTLTSHADGPLVRTADELRPGQRIVTRFARGRAWSAVERTTSAEEQAGDWPGTEPAPPARET